MIVNPNGSPMRSKASALDFATHADVQQQITVMFGALADLCTELCERVQAIEDRLGIVAPEKPERPV